VSWFIANEITYAFSAERGSAAARGQFSASGAYAKGSSRSMISASPIRFAWMGPPRCSLQTASGVLSALAQEWNERDAGYRALTEQLSIRVMSISPASALKSIVIDVDMRKSSTRCTNLRTRVSEPLRVICRRHVSRINPIPLLRATSRHPSPITIVIA